MPEALPDHVTRYIRQADTHRALKLIAAASTSDGDRLAMLAQAARLAMASDEPDPDHQREMRQDMKRVWGDDFYD